MATLPNNAKTKRLNVSIPESLADRVDAEATSLSLSRAAMMTVIIREYFKAQDSKELIDIAQAIMNKAVTIQENPDLWKKTEIGDELETAIKEFNDKHEK